MRRLLAPLVLLALCAVASPAHALDLYGVDLKIGLRGGPNIPLMLEPGDSDLFPGIPYNDYTGLGWNIGGAINIRAFDIVGLEVGYFHSWERVSASIELEGVRVCPEFTPTCSRQDIGQEMSLTSGHVPIVVQAAIPLGAARPFISAGIDLVLNRSNREYRVVEEDPYPQEFGGSLDCSDPANSDACEQWNADVTAQNALMATVNPGTDDVYAGIVAGIGVDIALEKVEIPVEFRAHFYPSSGGSMADRGSNFGAARLDGSTEVVRELGYNDVWTTQFFILFGLDYVIF